MSQLPPRAPRALVVANGIDRSEAAIFAGLHRGGLHVTLLHEPTVAHSTLTALDAAGVPRSPLWVRHRVDIHAIRKIRTLLDTQTFDLVYAPINRTLSASLLASHGTATPIIGYRGTLGHISRWDPACWLTYLHPRIAHIVCVSEAVRNHLINDVRLPPERLTRIYKGHDPAWYHAATSPAASSTDLAGTASPPHASASDTTLPPALEGTLTIVFSGHIRPVKGVRYLLEALRLIPASEPIRLVLIGRQDEPQVSRLMTAPRIAPRVIALGHQSNATRWYPQCDVMVMPSIAREGLPRAVVEAMALGLPVIASDVGGLPEVVLHEETGLIVPPRNPAALAEALRRLRTQPELRRRMGEAGRARVDATFHVRHSIAAFDRLFRQIASR